jgi:hypothetical protein
VDPAVWRKNWIVDIQPVGDGQAVLKYLAPYVHRVAISDNRILACDDHSVTFCCTPSGQHRSVTRKVAGSEFVRGFLQHTLPTGFQKVRYYGWMSPHCRTNREAIRWLLWLYLGWIFWLGSRTTADAAQQLHPREPRCQRCGGTLRVTRITDHLGHVLYEHPLPYLDSS